MVAKLTTAEKNRRRRSVAKVGPKKVGRSKKEVKLPSLERMAMMQCTNQEMAAILGMSARTFGLKIKEDPVFAETIERGREIGKVNLRMLQQRHAEGEGGPAVNMTMHLSKHVLGQFDKPVDTHSTVDVKIELISAGERISAKFDEIERRLAGPVAGEEGLPVIDGTFSVVDPGAAFAEIKADSQLVEGRDNGDLAEGSPGGLPS